MIGERTVNPLLMPEDIPGYNDPHRIKIYESLANSWAATFRREVLPNLPIHKITQAYCQSNGRPTKDLVTLTGLTVLQELFNQTDAQAMASLTGDCHYHLALGLTREMLTDDYLVMCPKTYYNFKQRLLTFDLGGVLFADITKDLVDRFKVDLSLQRLDSVHLNSNMKKAGRLAIMSATVEKFLKSLRRRAPVAFETLDGGLVDTYLPRDESGRKYFGMDLKPSERESAMLAVATDLCGLVYKFESDPVIAGMKEYELLARVLNDQCDVKCGGRPLGALKSDDALIRPDRDLIEYWGEDLEERPPFEIAMKAPKDVSSESLQYPTDPDASFSGHKGKGFQAQITETVVASKDPKVKSGSLNLIVDVEVEGAAKSDAEALPRVVDRLSENNLKPEKLLCDTSYGGQDNCEYAESKGVELVAPVPGKEGAPKTGKDAEGPDRVNGWSASASPELLALDAADRTEAMSDEHEPSEAGPAGPLWLSDFSLDEDGEIKICPMGEERQGIVKKGEGRRIYFPHPACSTCPRRGDCPVKVSRNKARLSYGRKELEIAFRRAKQKMKEFADLYRWRAGIEATNSFMARLGLKRLRIRGLLKVDFKVKLKALGVNIRRVFSFVSRNTQKLAFN